MRVGYELDKILVEPPQYWAYRIKGGRRVRSFGPYATEARAREEIDAQRDLDQDDIDRSRIDPTEHRDEGEHK